MSVYIFVGEKATSILKLKETDEKIKENSNRASPEINSHFMSQHEGLRCYAKKVDLELENLRSEGSN
jgi:hypothetical protein